MMLGTRKSLPVAPWSLALIASVALVLVGCGGEKGSAAGATVTVTVQETGQETSSDVSDGETEPPTETSESETEEALVAVEKMGFAQGEADEIGYGMVLKNRSATEDAIDVTITVNLLDAEGTIIESAAETINVIPAGATYYLGGSAYATGEMADTIEPIVAVGSSEDAEFTLPPTSRIRLLNEEYVGLRVKGQVENTLDKPLSQFAKIGIVVFDSAGEVLGGGFTYLDADLPPGRRASFDAGNGISPIPANEAKSANASVDNSVVTP